VLIPRRRMRLGLHTSDYGRTLTLCRHGLSVMETIPGSALTTPAIDLHAAPITRGRSAATAAHTFINGRVAPTMRQSPLVIAWNLPALTKPKTSGTAPRTTVPETFMPIEARR